jgi:hypothetical protein
VVVLFAFTKAQEAGVNTRFYWIFGVTGIAFGICLGCQTGPKITSDTAAVVNQTTIKNNDVEKIYQNRLKQSGQPLHQTRLDLAFDHLVAVDYDEMLMQRRIDNHRQR